MLEEGSSGSSVEGLLRGRVEESEVRSILGESCTDEVDSFLECLVGEGVMFVVEM